MIWQSLLGLLTLVGVIVLPMAAVFYGWRDLGWGFRHHPSVTKAIVALLVVLPIVAALTFGRLFPGCYNASVRGIHVPVGDCTKH